MREIDDRIKLQFVCPKCGKNFGKLPSWLKPGGAVTCPKCSETFVDHEVLNAARAFAERCKALGIFH